jgi:hypothetical protein
MAGLSKGDVEINNAAEDGKINDDGPIHAETISQQSTLPKWKVSRTGDGDTALALFSDPADLHDAISPAEERRLQRKIDFMILPYLAVCYAFFYIDKTTLSYAAIFGIRDDLHLVGTQYSWLSSIFYFGFLVCIRFMWMYNLLIGVRYGQSPRTS